MRYREIGTRLERICARVNEYGGGYALKRSAFRRKITRNPKQHISYAMWRSANSLTNTQIRRQRKRWKLRDLQTSPHFLVAVDTLHATESMLDRTKLAMKRQTWHPDRVFIGTSASLAQRMDSYIREKALNNVWILKIPAGDIPEPDFLYRCQQAIRENPKNTLWYTDEEEWKTADASVEERTPYFKPDFSEDYLCSWNYIGNAFLAKGSLYGDKLTRLTQDSYSFLLDMAATDESIGHISRMLYERQQYDAQPAKEENEETSSREAVCEAICRVYQEQGGYTLQNVSVERGPSGTNRVRLFWQERPTVSVIIPNKDHVHDLLICLQSLQKQSIRGQLEILIVENNSEEPETAAFYHFLETGERSEGLSSKLAEQSLYKELHERLRILHWDQGFNYSAINNFAAAQAKGEYLLLLNNDVELIGEDALERLLETGMSQNVGIVGAKLYYEDETVQHAGVIVGFRGVGGHAFVGLPASESGYMKQADCLRQVSAVTAACMLVRKSVFDAVKGLEEGYAVAFNDVDFCLKVCQTGAKILYQPACEAWHAESKTRGTDLEGEKLRRFQQEIQLFLDTWQEFLLQGDPFYNRNLSLEHDDYSFRDPYLFDECL